MSMGGKGTTLRPRAGSRGKRWGLAIASLLALAAPWGGVRAAQASDAAVNATAATIEAVMSRAPAQSGASNRAELVDQLMVPIPTACMDNLAPVANAGVDLVATVGTPVSFDGTLSYDADGSLWPPVWQFGDGQSAQGDQVAHTYAATGVYPVTLTVTDDCGAASTDTIVVDVTDPTVASASFSINPNPVEIQENIAFSAVTPENLVVLYTWSFSDGKSAVGRNYTRKFSYAGNYTATLKVYPTSGPMITQTKSFAVSPGLTLLQIVNSEVVNLPRGFAVVNGTAWAAGDVQGLANAEVSGGANTSLPVEATLPGAPWHIATSDTLVAVASSWGGIFLFNAQSASVVPVGHFDTYRHDGSYAYHVALHAGYLYAACYGHLKIIDVRNPANPQYIGLWQGVGSISTVDVIDGRAYVYDSGLGGIHVLDLSNPAAPLEVGAFLTEDYPEDIAHADGLLAIAEGYGGVEIFDFTDPEQPELRVRRAYTGDGVKGVELRGNKLYVAFGSRIEKLSVSNPAAPTLIQWVGLGRLAFELQIDGDYLYASTAQGVTAILRP